MGIYKIKIADCDLSAEYSVHEGMASIDGMTPDDSDETVIDSLTLSKKDDNGNEIHSDYYKMMGIVFKSNYHGYVGIEYEGNKHSEMDGIRLTRDLLIKVRNS